MVQLTWTVPLHLSMNLPWKQSNRSRNSKKAVPISKSRIRHTIFMSQFYLVLRIFYNRSCRNGQLSGEMAAAPNSNSAHISWRFGDLEFPVSKIRGSDAIVSEERKWKVPRGGKCAMCHDSHEIHNFLSLVVDKLYSNVRPTLLKPLQAAVRYRLYDFLDTFGNEYVPENHIICPHYGKLYKRRNVLVHYLDQEHEK